MRLLPALRLETIPRLALVGAGGKTTAMYRIGGELLGQSSQNGPANTVFLTATTHLADDQVLLADHHFPIIDAGELTAVEESIPGGLILLTGLRLEAERTSGLGLPILDHLLRLADTRQVPLLIEADGSRRRPIKAPAGHEPVIPPWVDTVILVAGLSGLEKPLSEEFVHRPERFAQLSGLSLGDNITVEALAQVMVSPEGGLKDVPPGVRRVVLLNQADTTERQVLGRRLGKLLAGSFQSILVAALEPKISAANPPEAPSIIGEPVFSVHEPVAGVILAAGASSRLGRPKQLLPWRSKPLVRHVAQTALAAGLSPVVVVTGFSAAEVENAVLGLPVIIKFNPEWESGQSASIQAGLQCLPESTAATVFLLADQPQIPVELVKEIIETHSTTLSPLVAPLVNGQRANPVLFDRQTFHDLMSLTGDIGGRALFARHQVTWLPWQDPGIALDIDTLEDYERLLQS